MTQCSQELLAACKAEVQRSHSHVSNHKISSKIVSVVTSRTILGEGARIQWHPPVACRTKKDVDRQGTERRTEKKEEGWQVTLLMKHEEHLRQSHSRALWLAGSLLRSSKSLGRSAICQRSTRCRLWQSNNEFRWLGSDHRTVYIWSLGSFFNGDKQQLNRRSESSKEHWGGVTCVTNHSSFVLDLLYL